MQKYSLLRVELEGASLAVTVLVVELATVIQTVVAISTGSWDRLDMRWQTRLKVR